jgi:hypothetical protein
VVSTELALVKGEVGVQGIKGTTVAAAGIRPENAVFKNGFGTCCQAEGAATFGCL